MAKKQTQTEIDSQAYNRGTWRPSDLKTIPESKRIEDRINALERRTDASSQEVQIEIRKLEAELAAKSGYSRR